MKRAQLIFETSVLCKVVSERQHSFIYKKSRYEIVKRQKQHELKESLLTEVRVFVSLLPPSYFLTFFQKKRGIIKMLFTSSQFFLSGKTLWNTSLKYLMKICYRKEISTVCTQLNAAGLLWATIGSAILVLNFPALRLLDFSRTF